MKLIKKAILLGSCTLLALGLVGAAMITFGLPDYMIPLRDQYQQRFATIDSSDGIDEREANELANIYLDELISGCGATEKLQLNNGVWSARLRIGYAATLTDKFVMIDARSGAVSSTDGPTFPNVWAFRTNVILGIVWRRSHGYAF